MIIVLTKMSVVAGEDSESEEEVYTGSSPPTKESMGLLPGTLPGAPTAEVVEGEASESEEEEVLEEQPSPTVDRVQPALRSTTRPEFDTSERCGFGEKVGI